MKTSTLLQSFEKPIEYNLDSARYRALLDDFRVKYKGHAERAVGATVMVAAVASDNPLSNLARAIEVERFGYSEEAFHREFDAWEASTHFLIAFDTETVTPIGCLRGIVTLAGLGQTAKSVYDVIADPTYRHTVRFDKYGNEIVDLREAGAPSPAELAGHIGSSIEPDTHSFDRAFVESYHGMHPGDTIYDVATVCARTGVQNAASVAPMLYAAAARLCWDVRGAHCVTILRTDLFEVLTKVTGLRLEPLSGVGEFMYCEGDDFLSQPLYMCMRDFERDAARELRRRQTGVAPRLGYRFSRFMDLVGSETSDHLFLL